ncbi:hypothetical protein F4820DRAFT_452224 [Hypoxylon rubiginosum]|uniref:Uncharacterized protein n=1 Tax=Hypoxylon rubiginosum TaxID=110542 RepID=A0ACB9YP03_9PEZI|nr:hypothetical protein F4820DRAFT_452224 [Hypoxylon rubiginosum]
MDAHHDSAAESIRSRSYISPSVLGPSRQPSSSTRRWGFGRSQNRNSAYYSDRENRVSIRSSVTYPSDTTFEATIVKGTAQTGQRYQAKTQLIDLGRPRRKSWGPEEQSPQSSHTVAETASLPVSRHDSEEEAEDQFTDHQAATEMYHNAIAPMAKTPSSGLSPRLLPIQTESSVPTPTRTRACTIRNFFRRQNRPYRARSRTEERAGSLEAGFASIILQPPAEQHIRADQRASLGGASLSRQSNFDARSTC